MLWATWVELQLALADLLAAVEDDSPDAMGAFMEWSHQNRFELEQRARLGKTVFHLN